jgi:hypothetical protein
LCRDTQGAIELARGVLPGDYRGEFYYLVIIELGLNAFEEVVIDVTITQRHRIGIGEGNLLTLGEQFARLPVLESVKLCIRMAQLTADRSVQVCSEDAPVENGHPAIE